METAATLTEAHRLAQAAVATRTTAKMAILYSAVLDPARLDDSFTRYLSAASAVIDAGRRESAALSGAYYLHHRELLEVVGSLDVAYAGSLPPEQVAVSLVVTGPVTVKRSLIRGATIDEAMSLGLQATLAATIRHTQNAGRDTILNTTLRDRQALGYQRVTDGKPCYRCAMYASRGPVYRTRETALYRRGGGKYHDGCGCTVEAVYRRDQPWAGDARSFAALWSDATSGLSGNDAVNAFRRAHERG